jgi:tRNA (cytidine56-2'-O)-methyltransferase
MSKLKMDTIPTKEKCIELLEEEGCSKSIIKHCKAVQNLAVRIAKIANADVELVKAGSLLHDIGRSKTNTIYHAIEGAQIAKRLGLSKEIVKIIERHIGAGISSENAKKLGLPLKNYIPQTLEEKIVCHADNLIDHNKRQDIEYEIEKALKYNLKEYALRLKILHKELSKICGKNINDI